MRVLAVHFAMAACFSFPLSYLAGPLLVLFGQPASIAAHVQDFVWIRLCGVPGIILISDVGTFLNSRAWRVTNPGPLGASAAVPCSFPLLRADPTVRGSRRA